MILFGVSPGFPSKLVTRLVLGGRVEQLWGVMLRLILASILALKIVQTVKGLASLDARVEMRLI